MSTSIRLGEEIKHNGQTCFVQRIVHSSTLFEDEKECYILEEDYTQIQAENGAITFIIHSSTKHPFMKTSKLKGVNPSVWKKF